MRVSFNELTAADVMNGSAVTIPVVMPLRGAAQVMADAETSVAPVVDARGRCVGLLRASDVFQRMAHGAGADAAPDDFWSEWQMAPLDEPHFV